MLRPVLMRLLPCLAGLLAIVASPARADDPLVPPVSSPLPLTVSPSLHAYDATIAKPLTIAQQRARYEADQRMLRMQWNNWIGYEPLRPALPNALTNNEINHHYFQPVRNRPVWAVWNNGSRPW